MRCHRRGKLKNMRSQILFCYVNVSSLHPPFILQYAGTSWDELKHIRQAVGFLVIFLKLLFAKGGLSFI